jgi:hypothetical protein
MLSGRLLDYGIPKMQENEASIDRTRSRGTYAAPRSVRQLDPHAIVAAVIFVAVIGLAIWYLARPAPLLVKHRNPWSYRGAR